MTEFPIRNHPDCENIFCDTCLRDHDLLDSYISDRIDPNRRTDVLSRYRTWLDRNKIHAETNGWASMEAWEQDTVDEFINYVGYDPETGDELSAQGGDDEQTTGR